MQAKQLSLIIFSLFCLSFIFHENIFAIDTCDEGWKVEQNGNKTIDCRGLCRVVINNCSAPIFVPTASLSEWQEFLSNFPQCVDVRTCTFTLSVSKSGSGSGTVTSNPSGINCGSICSASFEMNSQVTLTASPSSGSVFGGWSGDCSGSNTTCTLTMNSNKSVTATFNLSSGGSNPTPPPIETPPPESCCNYCPCSCTTRDVGTCTDFDYCWNSKTLQWDPCCKIYRINATIHEECDWIGGEAKCYRICTLNIAYVRTIGGWCDNTCPSPGQQFCSKPKQLSLILKKNSWLQK